MDRTQAMPQIDKKSFESPDEVRTFDHGRLELVTVSGVTFGRITLQPGWRWSTSVKPIAGTETCELAHLQFLIAGHMHVVMDDGTEADFDPGDVFSLPPGHDAWVVGDETVLAVDIGGMSGYAKGD